MVGFKTISEILDIAKGKKVNSSQIKTKNSVPYLLIDTLRGKEPEFFTEDTKYTEANERDILMVFDGANSGLVGSGLKGAVGSTIGRLRPKKDICSKYITYFLFYNFSSLNQDVKGSAIPHVKPKKLLDLKIRFPSLEEQQQIVEEIEKQFTRLDASVKDLKGVKGKLEVYKKSVLKAAFQGLFTNDREQKKEMEVLGFNLLIPKSWSVGKLSDLGNYGRGKSKHRPRNDRILYENGKYPFIQTGDISRANKTVRDYNQSYNEIGLKQSKMWPKGTLCITIAANIAKTAILNFDACFPDSVIGFNSKSEKKTLFVMYYIQLIQQILDIKASATAQKNINLGTFMKTNFPVIDEKLMEEIVNKIESKFSVIDKLEEYVDSALTKTEQLRKSILKSAFEGKLVK